LAQGPQKKLSLIISNMLPQELGFEAKGHETKIQETSSPAQSNSIRPFLQHGQNEIMHHIRITRAIKLAHFPPVETPKEAAAALKTYIEKRTGYRGVSIENWPGTGNFVIIHRDVSVPVPEPLERKTG